MARTDRMLLIEALTPIAIGSGEGDAYADRLVASSVWEGIPLLPHSALKGALGRQDDDCPRQPLFGDALLAAFGLPLPQGGWVDVLCGSTLAAFRDLLPPGGDEGFPALGREDVLVSGSPTALPLLRPEWRLLSDDGGLIQGWRQLLGLHGHQGAMLVGSEVAAGLWAAARELRPHVTLDADGAARAGSLRVEEAVPALSRFLCRVTLSPAAEWEPPRGPRNIGADLGCGLGFFQASWAAWRRDDSVTEGRVSGERGVTISRQSDRTELMLQAYRSWQAVSEDSPNQGGAGIRELRAIVQELPSRIRQCGLRASLAFSCDKALRADGGVARAHAVLLRLLFPAAAEDQEAVRRALAVIRGREEPPADLGRRLEWLKRMGQCHEPANGSKLLSQGEV